MGKIERLIAIVMVLLQKDLVSATEFSKLFNVSKRTILRDMETLSMSNIPIYAMNGVNGGYGVMEEYKLDKRLLTSKDLEHILTALSGLEQILVSQEVEITLRKIESMVSAAAPHRSMQLSFYDWEGRTEIQQTLKIVQEGIRQSRLVSFDYIDRQGVTTNRRIEPVQLHFSEMSWYLKGFCLDRLDYRTFKLSRTDNLTLRMKTFTPRAHLADPVAGQRDQPPLVAVKALISPSIKEHFIERYGRKSVDSYSSDLFITTIHVPQNPIGYQFIASFGTHLKIIEPSSYVEDFQRFLQEMVGSYTT